MPFKLSDRSFAKLEGVDPSLIRVVIQAIALTSVDFGVIEGVRTRERQQELFDTGASQTLNSKHIRGKAVDLMAYLSGRGSWELSLYDEIADAVRQAAIDQNVGIRWGGAWNIADIRLWAGSMESAMMYYIDGCRKQQKRPFIDAPHFELLT